MTSDTGVGTQDQLVRAGVRRAGRRLVPLLILLYFVNYLDRVNIGFAGPNGMNAELGLSATLFGVAAGVFFIGYLLLEVPSNLMLHRFGARRWIARILVTWGIVATIMAFVPNATWLIVLRFLLGVAEAGFFPGIILYLTYWFPAGQRARMTAYFMTAIPISTAVGAVLSTLIIQHGDGLFGLSGWRVMFLIEGIPSVLLAVVVWFLLTDRPSAAGWMPQAEREALEERLATEAKEVSEASPTSVLGALRSPRVLALSWVYFGVVYGLYALGFFLPTIIKGFAAQYGTHFSTVQQGLITAIPYVDRVGRDGRLDPPRGEPDGPGGRARAGRRHRDPGGPLPVEPVARDRRGHDLRVRRARRAARLLGAPHGLPDRRRGRGRHRAGQLVGQPLRLRGAVRHRSLVRRDRQQPARAVGGRDLHGVGRRRDLDAGAHAESPGRAGTRRMRRRGGAR